MDVTEHFLKRDQALLDRLKPTKLPMMHILYPVLLVNTELFEVESKSETKLTKKGHLLYQLSLETKETRFNYQIDVVTELALPDYLQLIDKEITQASKVFDEKEIEIVADLNRVMQEEQHAIAAKQLEELRKKNRSPIRFI